MVRTHGVRKSTAEQSDSTLGATVVIPTYNESESIERVIERCLTAMETSGYRTEVLVVDDDSPDGTVDVVHQRYGGDDRVSVLHRTSDPGLARAVTDGFRRARHEVCAVMDADLQHPPERLPALLDALESDGADVAVGSRYVRGGGIENWSTYRRLVSRVGTRLARLVLPKLRAVSDPLSGFFAVRQSALEGVEFSPQGYKILLEVLVKAEYGDVVEVPYAFSERNAGESKLTADEYVRFLDHLRSLWGDDGGGPVTTRRFDTEDTARATGCDGGIPEAPDVAMVTAYPPAKDGLADYAKKLVDGYAAVTHSVTVLGSGADDVEATDDHVETEHVWRKDDPRSLAGLARAVWRARHDHDVVHFNVKPTYFGSSNALRFLSLSLPLFARLTPGVDVVVTMHDVFEGVDASELDEQVGALERLGAAVATQLVLAAGPVTVTTEPYRRLLESKYPVCDVHHIPHGVALTDGSRAVQTDPFRVLLFGYVSPYKDYETVFEAFDRLRERHDAVELWVVGGDHPDHGAYAEAVRSTYGDREGVRFFGYVDEADLPDVFARASCLVLPYETAPGVSGPYQEAKARGLPVVVYDDEAVLRATVETGGDAVTTPPGSEAALADTLSRFVEEPERLRRLARASVDSDDPTMTDVARRLVGVASEGDL